MFQRITRRQYSRTGRQQRRRAGGPGMRGPQGRGTILQWDPGLSRIQGGADRRGARPGPVGRSVLGRCQMPLWFRPEYRSCWPFRMG